MSYILLFLNTNSPNKAILHESKGQEEENNSKIYYSQTGLSETILK